MAYKVFTNGSVLQASEINDNLMRQSVIVFSNAAARSAAITVPLEGMLTWLEDVNRYENYNGSAWVQLVTPSGLSLVKTQTIGTSVTSVNVTSAFSTDYDAYKIIIAGGVNTENGRLLRLALGASTTNYANVLFGGTYAGAASLVATTGVAGFQYAGLANTNTIAMNLELINPFLAKHTICNAIFEDGNGVGATIGKHSTATSYTDFTISVNSGSMTGGTIYVYGYRKS